MRASGQGQHHPGGAQCDLGGVDPLGEHLVPGADGLLDPLLHGAVDPPGVAVIGQDAEMGQQAGEIVRPAARADGVDVEQAHHLAVLDENLGLVEVAVHHVVRTHVHALLECRQTVPDRAHQCVQPWAERGHRGADDPGVEVHRVRPRRSQRQRIHRGGQAVEQRHQVLGATGAHALVDHRTGQRPPGQLCEDHEPVVMGDDLGNRHPGGEQTVMALHDLAAAMGLHDLEEHGAVALRGAQHGPAARAVRDHIDCDRQRGIGADVRAEVAQGAADDVGIADLRQHRQPGVVRVAPHTHIDVAVGHHQGLLGDVEVLLALADVGARAEELFARGCLRAVELGPGDHRAVEGLGAAARAVIDMVELPAVQHSTGVPDGRAEQPSRAGPGEELGAVLRV